MENKKFDVENKNQLNMQVDRDEFCWFCNKRSSRFSCSTCFRSFHGNCLRKLDKIFCISHCDQAGFICSICKKLKEYVMDKQWISRLLKILMQKVLLESNFVYLKQLDSKSMTNAVDLNDISHKIDNQLYGSFFEFIVDIRNIHHHCSTHELDNFMCYLAFKLLSFCGYEISNIESCFDCYENMHANPNGRSLACSQPHLVLWIQLNKNLHFWAAQEGYLYWPAKMISTDEINIKVVFFNDAKNTDFIEIPRNCCFIYSKKAPKSILKAQSMKNSKSVDKALKEVGDYLRNIEKKFGRFHIQSKLVPFNQLDVHMQDMFPDYAISLNAEKSEFNGSEGNCVKIEKRLNCLKKSSGNDDDRIPKKRQRLCNKSTIEREFRQTKENMENIVNYTTKLENTNKAYYFELNSLKESHAKIKEEHSKQMKSLNKARNRAMAEAKVKIEMLEQEKDVLQDILNQKLKELKSEKRRAIGEIKKLNVEHDKRVNELKMKIKSGNGTNVNDATQIMRKYKQIINNLKLKTEEAKKCKGCGELKLKLFCSPFCEDACTSFKESSFPIAQNVKQEKEWQSKYN